ncbi:MAG: hypothetical protein H0V44_07615 [Planctomycetes bacterium]|nr:hypothetical protein [Planctomycetota bacterium]
MSTIADLINSPTGYLPERSTLIPILYLTGAAGSLAYGTYALVDHVRESGARNSAGAIAKIAAPLAIGSGLVILGVRGFLKNGDRPSRTVHSSSGSEPRSRRSQHGARARRSRAAKPDQL